VADLRVSGLLTIQAAGVVYQTAVGRQIQFAAGYLAGVGIDRTDLSQRGEMARQYGLGQQRVLPGIAMVGATMGAQVFRLGTGPEAGPFGLFWALTHPGTKGIGVHIGHAGHHRSHLQQRHRKKTAFPEVALAMVLGVGPVADALLEELHQPTDRAQAFSVLLHPGGVPAVAADHLIGGRQNLVGDPGPHGHRLHTQAGQVLGVQRRHPIRPRPQHEVNMVGHHRPGVQIDLEDLKQLRHQGADPGLTVGMVAVQQPLSAGAARNDMKGAASAVRGDPGAGVGHGSSVTGRSAKDKCDHSSDSPWINAYSSNSCL
jgi:hypothetical protein